MKLVGDIICAFPAKNDYCKYICILFEVRELQEKLSKQKKRERYYQYSKNTRITHVMESPVLWLLPACYQNDPEEGRFIFEYLSSAMAKTGGVLKGILKELNTGAGFDGNTIAFIRSLSECKDDLLWWDSSYAENGKGISIGIHSRKFDKAYNKSVIGTFIPFTPSPGFSAREKTRSLPC